MRVPKGIGITIILIGLLLGVFLGACAPPVKTPAPEEKTIPVGFLASLTGPLASLTKPLDTGTIDYVRYVNEVQGGIKYQGHAGEETVRLDLRWEDTAYDPGRAVSTYKRLKAEGYNMTMFATAPSIIIPLAELLKRDRIFIFSWGYTDPILMEKPVWSVASLYGYVSEITAIMAWVRENLWQEARSPRVGLVVIDTVTSRGHLPGGLDGHLRNVGVELIGIEWVPYAVTDSSVELTRLMAKGADYILIAHVPGAVGVILKDAVRLGIKGKVGWIVVPWGFGKELLVTMPDIVEGIYTGLFGPAPTEDIPGVRLARRIADRYRPGFEVDRWYLEGLARGIVAVSSIRKALEDVGYENLATEAIRDAYFSLKGLDTGGIYPPISPDPGSGSYSPGVVLYHVEGGRLKKASEWIPYRNIW